MTSSAFIYKPCFRARIKTVQNTYQNVQEFFQKIMGKTLVSEFVTKQPLQQLKFLLLLGLLCQQLCDKISCKILLISQNHFSGFLIFQKNTKGELALAYESYAGGILIVILIEILNDYCFILYQLATMSPLGSHPPHLVDNTDTQHLGDQH